MLLHTAATALRRISVGKAVAGDAVSIEQALDVPPVGAVLAAALTHVVAHEPQLMTSLRDDILPMLSRRAIGEQLRNLMPECG